MVAIRRGACAAIELCCRVARRAQLVNVFARAPVTSRFPLPIGKATLGSGQTFGRVLRLRPAIQARQMSLEGGKHVLAIARPGLRAQARHAIYSDKTTALGLSYAGAIPSTLGWKFPCRCDSYKWSLGTGGGLWPPLRNRLAQGAGAPFVPVVPCKRRISRGRAADVAAWPPIAPAGSPTSRLPHDHRFNRGFP